MSFVLEIKTFDAGDKCIHIGDEHFWRWRRMCFEQETNTYFSARDDWVENEHLNFSHTLAASYQQLPNLP